MLKLPLLKLWSISFGLYGGNHVGQHRKMLKFLCWLINLESPILMAWNLVEKPSMQFCRSFRNLVLTAFNFHNYDFDDVIWKWSMISSGYAVMQLRSRNGQLLVAQYLANTLTLFHKLQIKNEK